MQYDIAPIVYIKDLEDAINLQYGLNITDLEDLLFEGYSIGNYQLFRFDVNFDYEEEIEPIVNCIKEYLKDIFPEYNYIIIELTW